MVDQSLLIDLALILLAARLLGEIALRLNAPAIIGELCAGILLGPSLLGWIEPNAVLKLLAEIGIILLLFEVGIETELDKLLHAGKKSLVVAIAGFALPFVFGFSTSYWLFSLPLLVSLFIGGALTATSIGITIRILADHNKHNSHEGQIVLGAAVLDDLLGVFLLAILYDFSTTGQVNLPHVVTVVIYISLFLILAPIAAKLVTPLIMQQHYSSKIPGLIPTVLVSLVLLLAYLAHITGAPDLLGGFVAGIAFSRRFFLPFGTLIKADSKFTDVVRIQMKPIIQLFTPIFFVMVGLSLDLGAVDWSSLFIWLFSLVTVTTAIFGKMLGPWLLNENYRTKIAIGMAMVPRGEVGLIFAELGRSAGILDATVYAGLILVIAYTTLASPIWIKHFYKRYP